MKRDFWQRADIIGFLDYSCTNAQVIGTLEAGRDIGHQESLFSEQAIQGLLLLLAETGPHLDACRPDQFLFELSRQITRVIGAGSTAIYLFERDRLAAAAGAGRASPDFIRQVLPQLPYPYKIISGGNPENESRVIAIDDPAELQSNHELLYKAGVRGLCIVPLPIDDTQGGAIAEVHVHYWDVPNAVSREKIQLLEAVTDEVLLALKQYTGLQRSARETERIRAIARLLNNIHSYATLPLDTALARTVSEIAYVLSATNATLYLLHPSRPKFHMPPTRVGTFFHPEAMEGEILDDDTPWNVLSNMDTDIRYVACAQTNPVLTQARRATANRADRFVLREHIQSCIIFHLGASEAYPRSGGLLFLNFIDRRDFDRVNPRMAEALRSSLVAFLEAYHLRQTLVQSLGRREQEIEAIRKIDQLLVEVPELPAFHTRVVEEAKIITGASRGTLFWSSNYPPGLEYVAGDLIRECEDPEGLQRSIVFKAYSERKTVTAPDDEQFADWDWRLSGQRPSLSELAVPLIENGGVTGVIKIEADEMARFGQQDALILETLAVLILLARHRINEFEVHQRAQRLTDWKKTTDQIAHTLKTQKHIVVGAIDEIDNLVLLLRTGKGVLDPDELTELLLDIREGMTGLDEKINSLRAFSTDEQPRPEPCWPSDLTDDALGRLVFGPGLEVFLNRQNPNCHLVVDRRQIVEALQEVLVNAVQATRDNGVGRPARIQIRTRVTEKAGESHWSVTIEDNGQGVPDHLIRRIFDPFVSLKPDGTGLGLAIAQQRIEGNGGQICVRRSEELGGACFDISFVVADCLKGKPEESK